MALHLSCWKCGTVSGVLVPLGRREECPRCGAELRCCRQCELYDARAGRECREPQAEPGWNKEEANFCDWFRPCPRPQPAAEGTAAALDDLNALFGGKGAGPTTSGTEASTREELERLFGPSPRDKR